MPPSTYLWNWNLLIKITSKRLREGWRMILLDSLIHQQSLSSEEFLQMTDMSLLLSSANCVT